MNKETKDILLKFDQEGRYETPTDFNYNDLKSRVVQLSKALENSFKLPFFIDDQIQDASFFCNLRIPSGLVANHSSNSLYAIRISNFGHLSTLTFIDAYSGKTRTTIENILSDHKFIFIDPDDLEEDYDGAFEKFNDVVGGTKPSWWIRYFDYL